MVTLKKQLLINLFASPIVSLLSLILRERISSEGLFSLYQGPTFYGHGFPWWFLKIYEKGSYSFQFRYFIYNILFWFICGFVLLIIFNGAIYIKSKVFLSKKR